MCQVAQLCLTLGDSVDRTIGSYIAGRFFTNSATREAPRHGRLVIPCFVNSVGSLLPLKSSPDSSAYAARPLILWSQITSAGLVSAALPDTVCSLQLQSDRVSHYLLAPRCPVILSGSCVFCPLGLEYPQPLLCLVSIPSSFSFTLLKYSLLCWYQEVPLVLCSEYIKYQNASHYLCHVLRGQSCLHSSLLSVCSAFLFSFASTSSLFLTQHQ